MLNDSKLIVMLLTGLISFAAFIMSVINCRREQKRREKEYEELKYERRTLLRRESFDSQRRMMEEGVKASRHVIELSEVSEKIKKSNQLEEPMMRAIHTVMEQENIIINYRDDGYRADSDKLMAIKMLTNVRNGLDELWKSVTICMCWYFCRDDIRMMLYEELENYNLYKVMNCIYDTKVKDFNFGVIEGENSMKLKELHDDKVIFVVDQLNTEILISYIIYKKEMNERIEIYSGNEYMSTWIQTLNDLDIIKQYNSKTKIVGEMTYDKFIGKYIEEMFDVHEINTHLEKANELLLFTPNILELMIGEVLSRKVNLNNNEIFMILNKEIINKIIKMTIAAYEHVDNNMTTSETIIGKQLHKSGRIILREIVFESENLITMINKCLFGQDMEAIRISWEGIKMKQDQQMRNLKEDIENLKRLNNTSIWYEELCNTQRKLKSKIEDRKINIGKVIEKKDMETMERNEENVKRLKENIKDDCMLFEGITDEGEDTMDETIKKVCMIGVILRQPCIDLENILTLRKKYLYSTIMNVEGKQYVFKDKEMGIICYMNKRIYVLREFETEMTNEYKIIYKDPISKEGFFTPGEMDKSIKLINTMRGMEKYENVIGAPVEPMLRIKNMEDRRTNEYYLSEMEDLLDNWYDSNLRVLRCALKLISTEMKAEGEYMCSHIMYENSGFSKEWKRNKRFTVCKRKLTIYYDKPLEINMYELNNNPVDKYGNIYLTKIKMKLKKVGQYSVDKQFGYKKYDIGYHMEKYIGNVNALPMFNEDSLYIKSSIGFNGWFKNIQTNNEEKIFKREDVLTQEVLERNREHVKAVSKIKSLEIRKKKMTIRNYEYIVGKGNWMFDFEKFNNDVKQVLKVDFKTWDCVQLVILTAISLIHPILQSGLKFSAPEELVYIVLNEAIENPKKITMLLKAKEGKIIKNEKEERDIEVMAIAAMITDVMTVKLFENEEYPKKNWIHRIPSKNSLYLRVMEKMDMEEGVVELAEVKELERAASRAYKEVERNISMHDAEDISMIMHHKNLFISNSIIYQKIEEENIKDSNRKMFEYLPIEQFNKKRKGLISHRNMIQFQAVYNKE